MGKIWPVQDAKARFSELIRAAKTEPQKVTLRGEEAAFVLSPEEYHRLTRFVQGPQKTAKPKTLADVLLNCPVVPEFELPPRRRELMRKIDFD
ncbi:MAG TPA: type II toxin-antitoxin system Phd/YefM family antitoxin [Rhizomicrobium sp.]|jgi:antitoxin Phd|nr:type II toxin-antitoxin system Phd/YefM family antitoxin [Rhizomicrobium sp.]